MNQRALLIASVAFIAIVALMFLYAYLKKAEITAPQDIFIETPQTSEADVKRIDAVHFFSDGTHTIAGEILMPTPCDLLTVEPRVAESFPEQVTLVFEVINNADSCAQILTPQRFRAEFDASKEARIEATYNGAPAILNLRDAQPGESPDTLEGDYFKG